MSTDDHSRDNRLTSHILSKYLSSYCVDASLFISKGNNCLDLAEHFGVSDETIRKWRRRYPEFGDAVKKALSDVGTRRKIIDKQPDVLYRSTYPAEAVLFLAQGHNMEELARHFNVQYTCLIHWKKVHPDFEAALSDAKNIPGNRVGKFAITRIICENVIKHLSQGYTKTAAAAMLGMSYSKFVYWEKESDEFAEAIEYGMSLCQLYWEKTGIKGMNGEIKNFSSPVWQLSMKSRFNFSDKTEVKTDQNITENVTIEFVGAGIKEEEEEEKTDKTDD